MNGKLKLRRRISLILAVVLPVVAVGLGAFSTGRWIPNSPSLQEYPVRGIDVSWHQGSIDWKAIPRAEVQFVYIKATEGGDYQDDYFTSYWRNSAEAGLRRGAYHFFTLKTGGLEQAANFKAVVPKDPQALPPAIDLEFEGNSAARPAPAVFQRELEIFIREVRGWYGREPVLYTDAEFRDHYLRDFPITRLWIRSVVTAPRKKQEPWVFWQYSGKGSTPGIEGFVDQNVFNGSMETFEAFLRREAVP